MKFKVSKQEIIRKKYIVPIQFTLPLLLFLGLVWVQQKSQEDFFLIIKILGFILIVMLIVNWIFTKKFIQFSEKHELNITSLGMIFSDNLEENTIYWNKVTKVIIKKKNKIFLEIDNEGLISLSIYENLDLLNLELKKYLNKELWI